MSPVTIDDWQLLEDFTVRNSDDAFRTLAERYTGMVYHSALRQLGDPHRAEEATQAVFIALAHKAGRLPRKTVVSGWLMRATRFAVLNLVREETRRHHREQEAAKMESTSNTRDTNPVWEQITPHLDDALNRLSPGDRDAVTIRFFENKSHRELAAALGLTEDVARRRVSRAVERLRGILSRRGVVLPAAALTACLAAHGVQAAPSGLVSTVTAAAGAKAAAGGAGSLSTLTSAKGILKLMAWAKLKAALLVGGAVLLAAGTAAVIVEEARPQTPPVAGGPLEGTIVLPDGTPAANVTVYLCGDRQWLDLTPDGRLNQPMNERTDGQLEPIRMRGGYTPAAQVQTGPDGRFVFNTWTNSSVLLMSDDRGFAFLVASNLTKETPITLKPMATVTGTLLVGARPAANELVRIVLNDPAEPLPSPLDFDRTSFNNRVEQRRNHVRTDAAGHFSFRVPAGDYRVSRDLGLPVKWSAMGFRVPALTQNIPVHAESDTTNQVNVGGEGRTVVGHVAGIGLDVVGWTNEAFFLDRTIPLPENVRATKDWKQYQAWYHSPEGRAAILAERRYFVETGPAGSFKIQDVAPGDYDLHFPLVKSYHIRPNARSDQSTGANVVDASIKFKIEPVPAGHDPDADPLDLGYLQRDWTTNYLPVWIKEGIVRPDGQPDSGSRPGAPRRPDGSRPGGPDPEMVIALKEQIQERQSEKSTVGETTIDLSRVVNAKLTEPLGEDVFIKSNTLAELPAGVHVFGGVPFNISGLVQLASGSSYQLLRPLPEESGNIAIGRKFKKLHILNGALEVQKLRSEYMLEPDLQEPGGARRRWQPEPPDPNPIAKLVLHYADGTQAELPIVQGGQLLQFEGPSMPMGLEDLSSNAELAWLGTNPYLKEYHPGWSLHLYRATFQNPKPDLEVTSVVYVSTMSPVMAPFIAGMTVE